MLFKILNDFHILCNVIEDIFNLDLAKKKISWEVRAPWCILDVRKYHKPKIKCCQKFCYCGTLHNNIANENY